MGCYFFYQRLPESTREGVGNIITLDIFTKDGVPEIINIQPKGSRVKIYQVSQIRDTILKNKLGG